MDHYLKGVDNGVDRKNPCATSSWTEPNGATQDQWPPTARGRTVLAPQTGSARSGNATRPFDNPDSFSTSFPIPPVPW